MEKLRARAHEIAKMDLTYKFGSDDPRKGGMDCSGTIQYLLSDLGVEGVPRTSYNQYDWLREKNRLRKLRGRKADKKLLRKLAPGDLIFWGGTWSSGHKVSHVMVYLGWNPKTDTHYVFGARGKKTKGLTGSGVDVFKLDPSRGKLVAHGRIPGLKY